jgi:hypothetical protein
VQDGLVTREQTAAMEFGTLAHLRFLEPERYMATTVVKPAGMSFATKEGKAWREAHAGKTIVSDDDARCIESMLSRLPEELGNICHGGKAEVTVRTFIGDLACQCRVDLWSTHHGLIDLKTITAIEKIDAAIHKNGYHIQQRWYQRLVKIETGRMLPFRFYFAEKAPPYRWRSVELDADYCALADAAIDDALSGIDARYKSGCWDDPDDLHMIVTPPTWMQVEDDEDEAA